MNNQTAVRHHPYIVTEEFRVKLDESLRVSGYGRHFFKGLSHCAQQGGTLQKAKFYAAAIFGTLFAGAATYFSFDGAVRMVDLSLKTEREGKPMPGDIGHGGEWMQQPFQYALAGHMYLFTALANRGHLVELKQLFKELLAELLQGEEGKDLSLLYEEFESDFRYLAGRSISSGNTIETKLELMQLFEGLDTSKFPCAPLDLDRALQKNYSSVVKELKEKNAWSLSNVKSDLSSGVSLIGKRGIGQAIETGVSFTVFQMAMLTTSAFMVWGLTRVFDEVFIAETGPEASGHLSEWSVNILTNFCLMYVIYSWLVKREVTLHKTRTVMSRHLQPDSAWDEESGVDRKKIEGRLLETFNRELDRQAEGCYSCVRYCVQKRIVG